MKTFFLEDYKGPDCENNSGLRIYIALSAGTRNNNEKYVLVQVYRRNPEWQISRGFAVGLPGSISISLNLDTDETPYDNHLLHLINEKRIAEDHWLILFVRRLAELLACTQHRKGRLGVNVLSDTGNMTLIRNSVQMIEPGQVGPTAALVSAIALTDIFNSLEDIERFAKVTGVIDVVSPFSAEESECCEPKFSSVHSIAESILTYTPPDTPEKLERENLESLFENNLSITPTKDNDIRNEMLLDQIIRETPQGQFLRAGHAAGGNGFIKIPNHFFVFKPFFSFTMKPKHNKKAPEHAPLPCTKHSPSSEQKTFLRSVRISTKMSCNLCWYLPDRTSLSWLQVTTTRRSMRSENILSHTSNKPLMNTEGCAAQVTLKAATAK